MFAFDRQVQSQLDQQRMIAELMTIFGLLALILAAVGLYGVTAYGVTRRTNEIGIRVALGADRRKVVGMVMGNVSVQAMVGLAIGAPIALAAGKFLSSKFPAVNAFDLAIAIFSVGFSALIAGFLPARRAANVDPMHTLRAE